MRSCPGMISAYVELARCYSALGMWEEASRTLHQCLNLQPRCSPVLVAVSVLLVVCFTFLRMHAKNPVCILFLSYSFRVIVH